jgi:CheY-like chemotaxis protein
MPTVLIADDNVDMLELIADTLEMNGFQTLKAVNGEQAWEILHSLKSISGLIILSDVKMPKLDGFGLLQRVRSTQGFTHLPLLLMSGDLTDRNSSMAAEADDFVLKPFRVEALMEKLLAVSS